MPAAGVSLDNDVRRRPEESNNRGDGIMRRFSISIRTLMAVVVVAAFGLAALRNANELWDAMMLMSVLFAVGVAILAAIFGRGREQAWWLGFTLFGGSYLGLAAGPWTGDTFRQRLVTTSLLGDLRNRMFESNTLSLLREKEEIRGQLAKLQPVPWTYDPVAASLRNGLRAIDEQLSKNRFVARRFDSFQSIGHSLFALLAGLVGGTIAVGFFTRRESCGIDAVPSPMESRPSPPGAIGR